MDGPEFLLASSKGKHALNCFYRQMRAYFLRLFSKSINLMTAGGNF